MPGRPRSHTVSIDRAIDRIDSTYARKLDHDPADPIGRRAPGPDRRLFASVRPALVPLLVAARTGAGEPESVSVNGELGGETTYSGLAPAVIRLRSLWFRT